MTSDEIMTSSLKKVINIDQNSHSLTAIFSFQIVDRIRLGSRRELVANSVHTTDADATQLDSRLCVSGLKTKSQPRECKFLPRPKICDQMNISLKIDNARTRFVYIFRRLSFKLYSAGSN